MGNLSKHFDREEFRCMGENCHPSGAGNCGFNTVDFQLIILLEKVRVRFGKPVKITSGCRCRSHNSLVGGRPTSQHLIGRAADIQVQDVSPNAVQDYLEDIVGGGMGRYKSFTHIDTRDKSARWSG